MYASTMTDTELDVRIAELEVALDYAKSRLLHEREELNEREEEALLMALSVLYEEQHDRSQRNAP